VQKLVREANSFDNVIFEIQNEPFSDRPVVERVVNPYLFPPSRNQFPNTIELADDLSLAWQARVEQWITSEEASLPNQHSIAQNYCDFGLPVKGLVPGVSIVNFHYAFLDAVSANYGLGKVIAYDETGFLGRDDDAYRREAWNFMLSGGGAFDALDYSFTVGHEDGTDTEPSGPGGGSPTLRRQLRVLSELLGKLALADLAPDQHTVKHAAGASARVLSNPGRQYAIYFDGNGPAEVMLELPAGEYSGEWINTKTGETEGLEDSATAAERRLCRHRHFRMELHCGWKRRFRTSRRPSTESCFLSIDARVAKLFPAGLNTSWVIFIVSRSGSSSRVQRSTTVPRRFRVLSIIFSPKRVRTSESPPPSGWSRPSSSPGHFDWILVGILCIQTE